MFGKIFGKRDVTQEVGVKITKILVRRSAVENSTSEYWAYSVVQEIVDFVNTALNEGHFTRKEFPDKLMQAYHADFYMARVLNGGHDQFLGHSHPILATAFIDVSSALKAMGAKEHLAIFNRLAAWATEKPNELADFYNMGPSPDLLDELDHEFYALQKISPLTEKSRAWIMSWPELTLVDDSDYPKAMKRFAATGPNQEARIAQKAVFRLLAHMTKEFQVSVGLACSSVEDTELCLEIGGAANLPINGQNMLVYNVRTTSPIQRACVVGEEHTTLYEVTIEGNVKNYRELARVSKSRILETLDFEKKHDAVYGVDLVLRKIGVKSSDVTIQPSNIHIIEGTRRLFWFLRTLEGADFIAVTQATDTTLVDIKTNNVVARVPKAEIFAWARKLEGALLR
jgi:hypothetical protein